METKSLLGLVHAILSGSAGNALADAIAQLNDLLEENEIPRLEPVTTYYAREVNQDAAGHSAVAPEYPAVLTEVSLSGLQAQCFARGVAAVCGKCWARLAEIDPRYLLANEANSSLVARRDLFANTDADTRRELISRGVASLLERLEPRPSRATVGVLYDAVSLTVVVYNVFGDWIGVFDAGLAGDTGAVGVERLADDLVAALIQRGVTAKRHDYALNLDEQWEVED